MQDRVGQVWATGVLVGCPELGVVPAIVLVVSSDLGEGMHRLLVLESGTTGWPAGRLKTRGELVEWPGSIGDKRIA